MSSRPIDTISACTRLASQQHGVIARRQAENAGLSKHAIYRLVSSGAWLRCHPSVYALWTPSTEGELWRQRLAATALWLGDGSAASHRAAAVVWGLDGVRAAPMEFTTTGRRRASKVGLIVHHVRYLAIEDLAHRDGIPVTTVPRTLVDLPAVADARTAELALESALRAGLTRVDQVKAALSRTPRSHRGRPALCAILDMHPLTATESELETRVWQLLRDAGLPPPTRQHKIRGPHGEVVARVDFAFVEAKLAIEADGYGSHSNPRDFRRDRKRHNALTRLGWTIYRVTWADALGRPHEVGLEIAELLRRCARPTVLSRWSIEP